MCLVFFDYPISLGKKVASLVIWAVRLKKASLTPIAFYIVYFLLLFSKILDTKS